MAKKQVGVVALLPDGRAVRVRRLNTTTMLDITARVGAQFPAGKDIPEPSRVAMSIAMEKAMVGACVTGLTRAPVEMTTKTRPATAEELAAGGAGTKPTVDDGIDFDATLRPLAENASDPRWTPLGELQLENFHESNELSMLELFDEPRTWKAVVDIINQSGGSSSTNPFAGKLLKTSAG